MANDNVQETIAALCDWIIDRAKNGAYSEELVVLPEVAKATASLIEVSKN